MGAFLYGMMIPEGGGDGYPVLVLKVDKFFMA